MSSRTALGDGGVHNTQSGSRGEGKQHNPPAEIIRMPSGSIVQIPSFEHLDLSQSRLHEALLFALPVSVLLWILIGLSVWGLISVAF